MENQIPIERRIKWYSSAVKHYEKVIDGKPAFLVRGFFTSDNVDQVGDIITKQATQKAVQKWRKVANIRYMHQNEPIGKALRIGEEDQLEWNECELKIVDPKSQNLIREDVLSGMSVGIIVNDAEPVDSTTKDPFWFMSGGMKILDYDMVEISMVDHMANLDARVTDHPGMMSAQNQQRAYIYKSIDLDALLKKEGASEVQTLLFDKEKFTEEEAKKWASDHDFKSSKVDITENKIRLRQFDPAECEKDSFGTKDMTDGVQAVFCVRQPAKSITPTDEKAGVKESDALVAEQRKEMDEKEKKVDETTPAVGAEETPIEEKVLEKKEEPTVEKAIEPEVQKANMEDAMKKMDEVMAKMDAMMAKMDEQKSATPEVTKSEESETTPVEPVKAEESSKGELEVTVKALLDEEKKARKSELEALTKTIMAEVSKQIEELKKPLPGKAAMKSDEKPEEKPVDLKTLTPGERRKKLKETLDKAFTQEN